MVAARTDRLPSGYVTFLFTDIEGSTRLFRRLGDGYVTVLEHHNALLRGVWATHDGVEVKTEGDAFMVAFAEASSAVAAAIDAQQQLAAAGWPDGVDVRVRMGLHSGLAAPRDGDYIAYAVHQAARVVGAAHGGQVLVSEETAASAGGAAPLTQIGRYRLRDFDEPIELFEAVVPGAGGDTRPPRAVPAMGHNLAPPATTFVGRDRDVAALTDLVRPGRVVTILGPGGVGKTRLATELGIRLVDAWADGVWLAAFASTAPGAPVAAPLAAALGLATGTDDPLDAISTHLRGTTALVILDNCEHVIAAVADLAAELIRTIPTIGIVATSREPLNIAGEQTWRIQPLDPHDGAAALFVDRAREAVDSFAPDPQQLEAIERICTRLDGVPLAIELAAARVDDIGLDAIETGLEDRFRFLRSRRRDLDPRQRSMEALLDWSFDLLDEPERMVFRRLSAFAGAFTLDAAEVAAIDELVAAGSAIDAVWALADKSLLAIDGTANITRFAMTETVRRYAGRRLDDAADRRPTLERLGAWFLDRYGPWRSLTPDEMSSLRLELDNLRAVVDGLAATDPETSQLLAISIVYARDVAGETREAVPEVDRLTAQLTEPSTARALLLAAAVRIHSRIGDHATTPLLDEAEDLLGRFGPEPDWAAGSISAMRALSLEAHGDLAGAVSLARQMTAADASDQQQARGYNTLGLLLGAAGDEAASLEAHRRGLAVEERIGAPIEVAIAHINIAEQSLRSGDTAAAARHQLEALELAAQIGSSLFVAFSLVVAARLEAGSGRWSEAARLHGAADRWLAESGAVLMPQDAALSADLLTEARRRLGDEYEQHRAAGHDLDLATTIDEARTSLRSAAG